MESFRPFFVDTYDPLRAGSIDGTDEYPHDKGIIRAINAVYKPNKFVKGVPECTVFVGKLNPSTTESSLRYSFKEFGKILNVRIVRDIITGCSKCYGFVEFTKDYEAEEAFRNGNRMVVDDHEVLVEFEKERTLKGWVPRRLGGGIGGKRESGQLRFGGRERPFKRPLDKMEKNNSKENSSSKRRDQGKEDYHERSRDSYRSKDRNRDTYRSKDEYRR